MSATGSRLRSLAALWLGAVLALGASPARGEDQPAPAAEDAVQGDDLERRMEALEEEIRNLRELLRERGDASEAARIAELEKRVEVLTEELERRRLGAAAYRPPEKGEHGLGPAASKVYQMERGVSIGGYGEMVYQNFDSVRDDGAPSGKSDQIDFLRAVMYFGYKFNDRILVNTEIEFEHASTDKSGTVSVEFAYLDFLFQDEVNVRAGMVLIPVGFLNELHEPPIFLGARRPGVSNVIIPTTWRENGAGVFGDLGPLAYRVYVVNSLDAAGFTAQAGLRGGRQKASKALAEDFALTGRFDWTIVPGLLVGVSGFVGNSGQGRQLTTGETFDGRVRLVDLHVEWKWRGLQTRGVWSRITIGDVAQINQLNGFVPGGGDSVGEKLAGAYVEAGYDVLAHLPTRQSLIPFLRVERYDTQVEVPRTFQRDPANDIDVLTLGVSYKPIPQVVLKVDFQDIRNAAGTGTDQVNVALGYMF